MWKILLWLPHIIRISFRHWNFIAMDDIKQAVGRKNAHWFCKVYNINKIYHSGVYFINLRLQEEYLYERTVNIIKSANRDDFTEDLLFPEACIPLTMLYKDRIQFAVWKLDKKSHKWSLEKIEHQYNILVI